MAPAPKGANGAPPAPTADETLEMFRLGLQLHREGQLQPAEAVYDEVLSRDPGNAEALHLKGLIRLQTGAAAEAAKLIRRAIACAATPAMHLNLGKALEALGRWEAAAQTYRAALGLAPFSGPAHRGLADALEKLGEPQAALASYDAALTLGGGDVSLHFNRGNVLRALARTADAVESYDAALALQPDFPIAHHNRAVCVLQQGRWPEGFAEYEWRKRCPEFDDARYGLPNPLASPDQLPGKRLFVFPELFLGDLIQFCRYARLAEAAGAQVTLAAPAALHALLRTLSPTIALLGADAQPEGFDLQCALMSLPLAFGTTPKTAPAQTPYLTADPARAERMRARLGADGLKVGVCWQGSTQAYAAAMARSFPLAALQPVAQVPGVRLVSLQKHDGLDQLQALAPGMSVETLGEDFDAGPDAFLDTAAAICACDLVISADTAVAHLAGALGAPTWLALPYAPDWRWGLGGETTPWYPSFRLFRQAAPGDWAPVFAAMAVAIADLAAQETPDA